MRQHWPESAPTERAAEVKVGIGLPSAIPGATGELVLDWARRADGGPFSTLGVIERVVYPAYEPMVTLAAAAGATTRIRLMTTIVLAAQRGAAREGGGKPE